MSEDRKQHIMLHDKGLSSFARLLLHGTDAQRERLYALARSGTEAELMELLAEADKAPGGDAS